MSGLAFLGLAGIGGAIGLVVASRIFGYEIAKRLDPPKLRMRQKHRVVHAVDVLVRGTRFTDLVRQGRFAWERDGSAYVLLGWWWRVPLWTTAHRIIHQAALTELTGANQR